MRGFNLITIRVSLYGCAVLIGCLMGSAVCSIVFAAPSNADLNGADPDSGLLVKIDEEPHTPETIFGVHGAPSFPTVAALAGSLDPFVLTSGNDDWGAWVNVIGSDDTPMRSGKDTYDIHEILIASVSAAATGGIEFGWDATTTTAILSNETFTSVAFQPSGVGANVSAGPVEIRMPDVPVGTLVFARCKIAGENAATVSIILQIHEFDL